MIAHNGREFNSNIVSKNLPQGRRVVNLIKNGAGIASLKIINRYVDEMKKSSICSF